MFAMEKYAVIKLGSKQFLVREGDVIELERQEKPLRVDVLFYSDGQKTVIGTPEVKDITVKAEVVEERLGEKVRVARFKKKSRYERVRGHRQPMSIVKIEIIGDGKPKKEEKEIKEEKVSEKPEVKEVKAEKVPEKPEVKEVKTGKVSEKSEVKENKAVAKTAETKKTPTSEKPKKPTSVKPTAKKPVDKKLKGEK